MTRRLAKVLPTSRDRSVADIARVRTLSGRTSNASSSFRGRKQGRFSRWATPIPCGPRNAGTMPFRACTGRLWGPGVLDMKGGLPFFVYAMRALRDLDMPVAPKVLLQLNSDEEVGSESSRALTEEERATERRRAGPRARHRTRRQAEDRAQGRSATTRFTVRGRAAHAGLDFAEGASAILGIGAPGREDRGFTRSGSSALPSAPASFRWHSQQRSAGGVHA